MALTTTEEAQTRALIAQQAAILSLASSEPTIISKLAATKVSLADLTAATSLSDTDLFLVRQGTTEKSVAKSLISTAIANASETVKGIVELATSAETLTGTDNTRAVHPAGLMSGFIKSLSTNGYQKLPSGLIIQWGGASISGSGGYTWTYPIAFPTGNLATFASAYAISTGDVTLRTAQPVNPGLTTCTFAFSVSGSSVSTATGFGFLAIGY